MIRRAQDPVLVFLKEATGDALGIFWEDVAFSLELVHNDPKGRSQNNGCTAEYFELFSQFSWGRHVSRVNWIDVEVAPM